MQFKLWLENIEFSTANEQGVQFITGKPVTFKYLRGKEKAPNFGPLYQQDIEPAGRYVIHNEDPGDRAEERWEIGTITFQHPLVIPFNLKNSVSYDENSWKSVLSQHYKKTEKGLRQAIKAAGYDGIVTTMNGHTREIVDISMF